MSRRLFADLFIAFWKPYCQFQKKKPPHQAVIKSLDKAKASQRMVIRFYGVVSETVEITLQNSPCRLAM